MTQTRDSHHIPYVFALDGVRALSIILVILTHTAPLGPKNWLLNSTAGPMGMSLFFCLSGYLIVSMIHRNPDPVPFLIRRVLRIVPAVAVYVLIIAVLFGISFQAVAANLLFVSNYVQAGIGVGEPDAPLSHLWSLSVEMQFYGLIALLAWIFGRRAVWVVIPLGITVTLLRIEAGAYVDIATHLRADEIMSGGMLALAGIYLGPRIKKFLSRRVLAWGLLIGITALWAGASHPLGGDLNYARPYLAAILVGLIIHSRFGVVHTLLEGRIARYIGRISYALYIYHPLMIFGWMNMGGDWTRYLLKRPISFGLTWIAAHISTYFWEQWWQNLAKRLTAQRKSVAG